MQIIHFADSAILCYRSLDACRCQSANTPISPQIKGIYNFDIYFEYFCSKQFHEYRQSVCNRFSKYTKSKCINYYKSNSSII